MYAIETKSKRCTVCRKTFYRKPGIALQLWEKRKTCSRSCHYKRARRKGLWFKKGHVAYPNTGTFKKGNVPVNKGTHQQTNDALKKWRENGGKSWNKGGGKTSEETRVKIREARAKQDMSGRRGSNHHFWKGGITPLRNKIRELNLYRKWRTEVFQRDDFICQHCLVRGGKLEADHIKSFSTILHDNEITTVEEAKLCSELWDVSNGRTLCKACHYKTATYGSKSIIKSNG